MLARMILAGQAGSGDPVEFAVTSDAEWDAVLAKPSSELAGNTIIVHGSDYTQRTISDVDTTPFGAPLTIRSADGNAALPSIIATGTVRGIDFSGLNFQMTGWPHDYEACFQFGTGTFGALRFIEGTTFRHGYGPSQVDFDTTADLPEYERIDNVQTATTTSTSHALTWQDSSMPSAWVYFFNRGAETVYVEVGGSGVTATTASAEVAPGSSLRITGLTPASDTHFAILSASGTSEINARTEIGLTQYLANAFFSEGGAVLEDIELRNCLFRDLRSAIKSLSPTERGIVMDCDLDRIYSDVMALSPEPGGSLYIFRNLECLPFARSGIAENLEGDARDPHGDQFQMFSDGAGTLGPVFYGGNRIRQTARRAGASNQGIFVSDNDFYPSYSNLYFISTMQTGAAPRALSIGEPIKAFDVRNVFVYGATLFDSSDIDNDEPFVMIDHDDSGTIYTGRVLATNFRDVDTPYPQDGNFRLGDAIDRSAVFPNLTDLASATDRLSIEAALSTAAEGAGIGAAATANAIDWMTKDHTAVILWENLPSGAHWNDVEQASTSAVVELPLRQILNRRPGQTVSVAPGTQWRGVDTDGTTEVQAWTASSGTIEPDQFIQIRVTASDTGGQTVTASVTINGFEQSLTVTSANTPAEFLIQGDPIGFFLDDNGVGSGVSRITARGKFYFPSLLPSGQVAFSQVSTGYELALAYDGSIRATVEDGTGAKMLNNDDVAPGGTLSPDVWHDVEFDADQVAEEVRLTVDGTTITTAFIASSNGLFQAGRAFSFLARSSGTLALPPGTQFADLSVDLNGVRHKTISNTAAIANTDSWHTGGDF